MYISRYVCMYIYNIYRAPRSRWTSTTWAKSRVSWARTARTRRTRAACMTTGTSSTTTRRAGGARLIPTATGVSTTSTWHPCSRSEDVCVDLVHSVTQSEGAWGKMEGGREGEVLSSPEVRRFTCVHLRTWIYQRLCRRSKCKAVKQNKVIRRPWRRTHSPSGMT